MANLIVPAVSTGNDGLAGVGVPRLTRQLEDNVAIRIFKSPLTWAVGDASIFVTATIILITSTVTLNPLAILTIAVSGVALGVLIFTKKSIIWRDGSLLALRIEVFVTHYLHRCCPSCFNEQRWYDEIRMPEVVFPAGRNVVLGLFLSALPMATMGHHEEMLRELNGNEGFSVLTVTMREENTESGLMGDPLYPTDWVELGVRHHQEEIIDLHAGNSDQLIRGSDFIYRNFIEGRNTLVHCKAGRQRSAKMIITYLMRYHLESLRFHRNGNEELIETAIRNVKECRPRIFITQRDRGEVLAAVNLAASRPPATATV